MGWASPCERISDVEYEEVVQTESEGCVDERRGMHGRKGLTGSFLQEGEKLRKRWMISGCEISGRRAWRRGSELDKVKNMSAVEESELKMSGDS